MRHICVMGVAGVGKSYLCFSCVPDLIIGKNKGHSLVDGTILVPSDESIRKSRALLGIKVDEKVCSVKMGEVYADARSRLGKNVQGRAINSLVDVMFTEICDSLADDVDVVLCDYAHAARENEAIFYLTAPLSVLEDRSKQKFWNRTAFNPANILKHLRHGLLEPNAWSVSPNIHHLYWHNDQWMPLVEGVKARIKELAPWYHHADLAGIAVAPPNAANGWEKWGHYRECMPESLKGLLCLDIGMNAGFNAFSMAREGANVIGYEPDKRFRTQHQLTRELGPDGQEITSRVEVRPALIQSAPIPEKHIDIALLGAIHYHVNRSGFAPYRAPRRDYGIPDLLPPLAVLLEDLLDKAGLVIIGTNKAHADRPPAKRPYPESLPEWIMDALIKIGFHDVKLATNHRITTPIVVARGRG